MNKIIIFLFVFIAGLSMFKAYGKYDIYPDTMAVGDVAKPEDGLAFVVQSTTLSALPCPKMTEAQRDALSPIPVGSCVFNTDAAVTQFYNGSGWNSAGSSAVLSSWSTGTAYGIGAFVYDPSTFKLYISNTSHTAGATLAGDIALGYWDEASDDVDKVSSTDNAVVKFDGTEGEVQDTGVLIDDSDNISGVANLTVSGTTTLDTSLNGFLFATSGVVSSSVATFEDVAVKGDYQIGSPTEADDLKEIYDFTQSSGIISGAALTDNGDGTIDIAAGQALLRSTDDPQTTLFSVSFNAQAGISLTDESINYVYLDYNSGSPQFAVGTASTSFNCMDKCLAYAVARDGNSINVIDARYQNVDLSRKLRRRFLNAERFLHSLGGSVLGQTGTRNITVTAGEYFFMLNSIPHDAFDTSVAGTANANVFSYYYQDGSGGWTEVADSKQIDNANYDDGSGTLASLTTNYYRVDYVYMIHNSPSSLAVVYGDSQYATIGAASNDVAPSSLPIFLSETGTLIGRVAVRQGASSLVAVQSSYETVIPFSGVTTHNNLAGLQGGTSSEYYHLTNTEHGNLTDANAQLADLHTDGSPTFSDATFTSVATFTELASDPSTPASGEKSIFAKDDGKLYSIDDAGIVSELGAGGGTGINWIDNDDIETDASGYATFDDASAYVDGTGGTAANLTLTRNTTTPLRGTGDLKLVQAAADSRYEGFSYDFTIDKGMQGEMLTASFWYDTSDANYVDDDIRIFIYDKDNSQIIRVNGEDIKGGKGVHYFQFQAASDADDYRVSFMVNQSNTNGYSIYFDQIAVSPTRLARGAIVTKEQSFTPDITNISETVDKAFWWRSGQFMHVYFEVVVDSNATSDVCITSPIDGYSVDTAKLGVRAVLGSGVHVASTNNLFQVVLDGAICFKVDGGSNIGATHPTGEGGVDTGDRITARFTVPIVGWEAEGTLSEDLGGGEVVVRGAGNGGGSVTGTTTDIDFTEVEDSSGAWNGSQFTAPESGYYDVKGEVYVTAAGVFYVRAHVDGTFIRNIGNSSTSEAVAFFNDRIKLLKGEVFSLRLSTTKTLNNDSQNHYITIKKDATGSQKFDTATVAAMYTSDSGQSLADSTDNVIIYEDKDDDTHNAYNASTGVYTVPVSGWYSISASITYNDIVVVADEFIRLAIDVDGTSVKVNRNEFGYSDTIRFSISINESSIYLQKGSEISIKEYHNTGASEPLYTTGSYNTFSISRTK